jgi:hypothetical protein
MAKSRREKTLADYVVIAISPALIMTLVGSLVFFLLELSYRGEFELRVRWILFWFVVGAVLVARIAIQEGRDHASVFGGALILVVGLGVFRFVDAIEAVMVVWVLLAVVWWCSWKLTWDCTLIDDSEDASGEGLLEAAGLSGGHDQDAAQPVPVEQRVVPAAGFNEAPLAGPTAGDRDASRSRPHAPGRWVVYFSLAALPLFGVGQLFIPAANTAGRAFGFQLLAIYVASALGLLLTTSFLGLRRYLRQRKLQMPMAMTGTWIGMGTGLVAVLLLLALLIPRPQGEYTLTALVDKIDAKAREASRFAVLQGDRAQGEGRRIGEQDQKAKQPGEGQQRQDPQQANDKQPGQAQGDDKQGDAKQGEGKQGEGKQGGQENRDAKNQAQAEGKDGKNAADKRAGEGGQKQQQQEQAAAKPQRPEDQGQRGGQPQNRQPQNQAQADDKRPPAPSPPGSPSSLLTQLAPLVKWILYGLMAAVLLYVAVRYWSRLAEILKQLWAELLSLFGFKEEPRAGAAAEEETPAAARLLPFAAYEDPFFSGAARRMPLAQLARYTFEALEAWAREQVIERPPEQTPLEFAQELGRRVPALAKDVTQTAQLYAQIAYARHSPSKDALEILERMWRRLQVAASVTRSSKS